MSKERQVKKIKTSMAIQPRISYCSNAANLENNKNSWPINCSTWTIMNADEQVVSTKKSNPKVNYVV